MNTALREHDMRALEPFLPYMKLLLSGLYRLPLVHVQTWRGVKLELHEVGDDSDEMDEIPTSLGIMISLGLIRVSLAVACTNLTGQDSRSDQCVPTSALVSCGLF